MTKKKIIITISILVIGGMILLYQANHPPYQVENVFDEIALANRKHFGTPYTEANFENFITSGLKDDEVRNMGLENYFIYDKNSNWHCVWEEEKKIVYISVIEQCLDFTDLRLICHYSLKDKTLTQDLAVYQSDSSLALLSKDEIEKLFQENGISVEEVYAQAKAELKKMLDEWIISNEGKSKFSPDDYGDYTEGEMGYYKRIWDDETELDTGDGWIL